MVTNVLLHTMHRIWLIDASNRIVQSVIISAHNPSSLERLHINQHAYSDKLSCWLFLNFHISKKKEEKNINSQFENFKYTEISSKNEKQHITLFLKIMIYNYYHDNK